MHDLKGSKKLLSSTEDRPIFEDLEGSRPRWRPRTWLSRPRPRTSKTVLEAKDVLEAISSLPSLSHNASVLQIKLLNMRRRRMWVWARLLWAYSVFIDKWLVSGYRPMEELNA